MGDHIDPATLLPTHQFGYILPVQVAEFIHYNFYKIFPDDAVFLCPPMNLQSFSGDGVETALPGFWGAFDFLVGRRVERITQGGIPISARLGRKRTLALLEEAQAKTSIPVSADFEDSIDALKMIGAKRIAVAAKWEPTLMQNVKDYLADAGLNVIGDVNEPHTAGEVVALSPAQGNAVALSLLRRAFAEHPTADAVLLAGGAWQNLAAIMEAEREFGRPVIANPMASYWAALKQSGLKPRQHGFSQLLDSLFDP